MGSRTRARSTRVDRYVWGCLIVFCVTLLLLFVLSRTNNEESERPTFKPASHQLPRADHADPDVFKKRASELHELRRSLNEPHNKEKAVEISTRCSRLTQHDQLLDTECTAVWLNVLREHEIVGVPRLWGFEDTHFGAITLDLEGGYRAMFKPCSSKSEDTSKEVIASYLDQLLQWGQTAPVITRVIPVATISRFVRSEDREVLSQTVTRCAKDGYFTGPMIGWWDSLIPIRSEYKYKVPLEEMPALRKKLSTNLLTTQMQSKYHAFYMLIHILRHGKDEFITKHGDLVSLDLDRSRFQSTTPLTSPAINYTWCYTCYMDKWVYDTFQAVGPRQPPENRLGALMKEMLSYEDIFADLWDSRLSDALDTRVSMLLSCIDSCIYERGANQVLLDQPKNMSPRQLVEWFVTNSVYKDRNGQKGPSNLDFLDDLEDF